jgi:hypothetical protein
MFASKLDERPIPRCDNHHSHMAETRVRFTDIQLETPAFQCAELGCTRLFTSGRGYFDFIQGRILKEKYQQRCGRCNSPMYLANIESKTEIWRCPVRGCGLEQRMAS